MITFNSHRENKPITIVIKFISEKEYKFFGNKNFYDEELKNIFNNTLFLDRIGDKTLREYIDKNYLTNENEEYWWEQKIFFNCFATRLKERNGAWQLKQEPFDNFGIMKNEYYHNLNAYCRYKRDHPFIYYMSPKQRNILCCKYNTINVICENDHDDHYLKLNQKYEGEECSYHLCFYRFFNFIKKFELEPFEITVKMFDKNNREINIWTQNNKPKYISIDNNRVKKKNIFYERINNEFCHYFDVPIPSISNMVKNTITPNSMNQEKKCKFILLLSLKYDGIDFYNHEIKINYIHN